MNSHTISPLPTRPTEPASPAAPISPSLGNIGAEQRNRADFRHLWHTVLEKLWILILCTIAGLFLALGYLARTPKLYQGHIVLEVDISEPTVVRSDDMSSRMRSAFLASQDALRTIEQNLTNRALMARVIRSESLADDDGRALLGLTKGAAPRAKKESAANTGATETALTQTEQALGGALSQMVKPVVRRGTRLIDLFVLNQDPALAQRLAEAVGREYIRSSIERRANFAEDTLRYLLEEEERLKRNLAKSEAAVAEYKAKTPDALQLGGGVNSNTSQNTAGRTGGVEEKLQELSTKSMAAKTERLRLEGELAQIEQAGDNLEALLSVPSIASAPAVVERRRDVAQVEAALATLSQRYKEKHPRMIAAKAALNETRAALKQTVMQQPAVLKNAIEQARATEESLRGAAGEQEKAALALNKAAIGYQELARQADTDRALYESVLRQIKETDLTKGTKANAVSVIEHSPLPGTPVSPSTMRVIALGFLGGIAAGLATIFGMNALDRSVKTVDQAETTFALPVLAAIPEVSREESKGPDAGANAPPGTSSYRLVAEAPEGPAAEAFRNLRAALSLLGPEAERKIFLFTSALPNEGKSFTSANYALSLAQQGHRVLLIDGDLRRPSLHKIFRQVGADGDPAGNGGQEQHGIVDYLVGDVALSDAVRIVSARDVDIIGTSDPNSTSTVTATGGQLCVLAGGRRAPNPAELLSGHSFAELVAEATAAFDRVVIDSAPVLAVSDTLLMTPHVQTVNMVVRARRTARNAVQRAILLLGGTGTRPAGVILNRLPRNRGTDYYYYYASHGYGAGEGSYTGGYAEQSRTQKLRRKKA
ncbi:MAG TPA: GNVR domain-containing protein [Chthoniobacterales bacterium]|nr:GNVR domain-containing protein [Chthoniobacterales bacterium]